MSLNTLQHLIPRAHYEIAKGKNSQAANYCKKDGNFKEVGTLPPDPGVKGGEAIKERYEAAFKLAKCGDLDTIDCDLLVKHYRTLKQIRIDYVTELPPLIKLLEFGFTATRELVNRAMPGRHIRVPTSRTVTSGGMVTKKKKMLLSMILTILIISWAITLKDGQTIMPLLQKLKEVLCISGLRKLSLLANFG